MHSKILVICATGKIGVELVKLLNKDGLNVRAAARNPSAASGLFPSQVEIAEFDFERPETFAKAVKGVDKIFLMARPGDNHSDKAAAPLIDEAKKQGVKHIVNLTAFGVEKDESFMLRILERYLEDSDIHYTHLRPNWYMQNFNTGSMLADIRLTGSLHLPAGDAKVSFIDARDIAAAGAVVLENDHHFGKAYTLTGGEALDHFQVVKFISRAAHKNISYVPISDESARAVLSEMGVAVDQIERWSEFFRKVRSGFCTPVFDDLEKILERPPLGFHQYAIDYAASWN